MRIYIEYVLIDNFVIDYLLLKATFLIVGKDAHKGRIIISAFLGAIIALLYPLLSDSVTLTTLVKILCGMLLMLVVAKYDSTRDFYLSTTIFYLLTFLTGGAIIGIFNLFSLSYSSELAIATMIIPAYMIIRAISKAITYIYRRRKVISALFDVEFFIGDRKVLARGFMDTGNLLYDKNAPVVIVGKKFAQKLLGDFHGVKLKKIKVATVNGESENLAFKPKAIKIYFQGQANIYNNVTVCVSSGFIGDGYEVILHPDFMEDKAYEKHDFKTEKIS